MITICSQCWTKYQTQHVEAMAIANETLDDGGVAEDSVLRGLASVQLAANANPNLGFCLKRCWPDIDSLLESPVTMHGFYEKGR